MNRSQPDKHILYASLMIAKIGPFFNKEKTFGFGINYDLLPEEALKYMDKRNLNGRILNTFQFGQYITWRNFPERTPFVDGRAHIPIDLLEKDDLAKRNRLVLDELYKKYGFESILIQYPFFNADQPEADVDFALSSPGWALVYWDDLSLLYLKRGGMYDSVIKGDEYKFVRPSNGIYRSRLGDTGYRSNLIKELKRNIEETGSSKAYAFLGLIYNETGLYKDAIDSYSKVRDLPEQTHIVDAYNGIAFAYYQLGYLDEAIKYYKKSLSIVKDANIFSSLGMAYVKKDDKKSALRYFKKALDMNRNLTFVYPLLIDIYRELGKKDDVYNLTRMYETAKVKGKGKRHFEKGVSAYLNKKYDIAIEEFEKAIEEIPLDPAPYSSLGYVYFDMGVFDKAFKYQKKAIDIYPQFANAHYGLAQIYKKMGDMRMAKRHWEEYLKIEPSGYFSRKAKEEIEDIKRSNSE